MKYAVTRDSLVISTEDLEDTEFLQGTLEVRTDSQALDDMCDGHTGWLGNQGPAPANIPALSQAPQLATGLEHDENNVPRWRGLYAFLAYERHDWRDVLLAHGSVTFSKVG